MRAGLDSIVALRRRERQHERVLLQGTKSSDARQLAREWHRFRFSASQRFSSRQLQLQACIVLVLELSRVI